MDSDSKITEKRKGKATKGIPVKRTKKRSVVYKENVDLKRTKAKKQKRKPRKRTVMKCSSEDDNAENENSSFEIKEIKKLITKETSKKSKPVLIYSSDGEDDGVDGKNLDEDHCVECLDYYSNTKSKVDWISCVMWQKCLHETCTLHRNYCNKCGRIKINNR